MSKRMYDTGIIQQSWYMELPPRSKALWWQLHAMMDNAGVFEINERMMEVMFGDKVTKAEIFGTFGGRVQPVPNHPDKGIFVDYVMWSNAKGLSKASPSQRSIIMRLTELGLTVAMLNSMSRKRFAVKVEPPPEKEEPPKPQKRKPVRERRFVPPTLGEVKEYIAEMGYKVDPERWWNYYASNGWEVGRNPMKDWRAAVRTWTSNGYGTGGTPNGGAQDRGSRRHASNWRDADLNPADSPDL